MKHGNYMYAVRSIIGNRAEQQDCVGVVTGNELLCVVVCDGMGGLNGGNSASAVAVEVMTDIFKKINDDDIIPEVLINSVDVLDEAVFMLTDETGNRLESGTTIVSVIIRNKDLFWMSVGDSRLYLIRNDEMVQATRDHNFELYLESVSETYTPTEKDLEMSQALISFIGMGGISVMDVSSNPVELIESDIILVASDGLYKALSDDEIKRIIKTNDNVETAADELLVAAEKAAPDTRDNTSFILIKTIK
ncbi:MAG: protein serine/threonine phosphatase 2C family protein [Clostridia bacterium]|nr:protein serine/threonine phosphatase 2C family protein [Clostridia bacterium]